MKYFSLILLFMAGCAGVQTPDDTALPTGPYLVVLGIGQDAGAPQSGSHRDTRWNDASRAHMATSLGLVEPNSGKRWMFEATPDFRTQWYNLDILAGLRDENVPDGIFLTHSHIGHYTGLMFVGHESIGANLVAVYALPEMASFLRTNGPWSQLVNHGNIQLHEIHADSATVLSEKIRVTAFTVPHRQEYSEVAGFVIEGPNKRVGFIPDIDSWTAWDQTGTSLESFLESVDLALLDGTFYANGEIKGRDMTGFPHPFITRTMERLATATDTVKAKVIFIHLNHTNPALEVDSDAFRIIHEAGFQVAFRGQIIEL